MTAGRYEFVDLVNAWCGAQRWANAHPDLAQHHAARYRAFSAAFDVDLDRAPTSAPPEPEWMATPIIEPRASMRRKNRWHLEVHRFALRTEERYRYLSGPFATYLEMPAEIVAVRDRYGPAIAEPLSSSRQAIFDMVLALFTALYPRAADQMVAADDLRHHGFDPDDLGPDPDDYW